MKEQNGKLSRDEFLSFVKAVLKKKSLEENKPLYFEYRLSENGEKEKILNRFDGLFRYDLPEGWTGADKLQGNYPDRNDALRPYECLILTKAE